MEQLCKNSFCKKKLQEYRELTTKLYDDIYTFDHENWAQFQCNERALKYYHPWSPSALHAPHRLCHQDAYHLYPHVNPGLRPTIAHGAIVPTITQAHFTYKVEKTQYDTYHATDTALKIQILQATPAMFTEELYDEAVGYTSVTTQKRLQHLWATYGLIEDDQFPANIVRKRNPGCPLR